MFSVLMCVNQPMSLSWRTRKKRKAQHSLDWLFEECKCIRCAFVALLCVRYAAFTRLYRWRSLSGCILNGTASVFLHKWPYLSDHIWDVLTVKIRSHSDLTKSCHLKTGEQPVYKWQQYKKKHFSSVCCMSPEIVQKCWTSFRCKTHLNALLCCASFCDSLQSCVFSLSRCQSQW